MQGIPAAEALFQVPLALQILVGPPEKPELQVAFATPKLLVTGQVAFPNTVSNGH